MANKNNHRSIPHRGPGDGPLQLSTPTVYGVLCEASGARYFYVDLDTALTAAEAAADDDRGTLLLAYQVLGDPAQLVAALNDDGWFDSARVVAAWGGLPHADAVHPQRLTLVEEPK